MADLSSILTDPNYVNANPATKQAIFDKFSANDTNFTGANPETQNAIRTKFGVAAPSGGIPVGRQGVDQFGIPGTIKPAEPEAPRSLGQRIMGNIETIPALAAGAVGGVVAPIAQLGHELTQGQAFTPQGKAAAAQFGQQVQGQFYQPRTPEAQRNVQAIGEAVAPLAALHIGGPTNALAPAIRAIGDVTRSEGSLVSGAASNALAGRAAKTQEANVAQSYQNAGRIEAANKGSEIGLVASPAAMNPTKANKAKAFLTDPKAIDAAAAESNAIRVPQLALNEMGLPANTALNSDVPFVAAREAASGPYKEVAKLPLMTAAPDIVKTVELLRPSKLVLGKDRAAALNEIIDTSIQDMSNGLTGAETVKSISDLRAQAQNISNSQKAGHPLAASELDKVGAYRGIANALEQMVEDNVTDPKLLNELQDARVKIAKIHAYEDATDFNTGKINPAKLAKATAENSKLTGDIATIGQFAGNFPESMGLTTPEAAAAAVKRTLSRATMSGAAGAAIGSIIPGVGSAVGLAAGAGLGELGSRVMAKRMISPSYQTANAIPKDYRPAQNMLRPVEPNYGPNQMVPYDYSQSVVMPGETPNFVFGRPEAQVNVGTQYAPNQLPAPSAAGTLGAVAAERARAAGMSRTMGTQAEAQQAAAEAATRQPTGRGSVLEFDPITGTYKVGGAGVKGATPEVFMSDTGASLKSASEKMASNQPFSLTAAEKVAWEKTKVDLAAAAPEFKSLSAKELSSKMQDRQWVSDTIDKIREKAQAFDEISKRASTAQAIRDAAMKREQMMDLLANLEDSMRAARPVQKGGQGPKTRAFQRNMLTPEQEIQNALVK